MPTISVIVPVYNVERYLQACIDSLLGQTFTDMELIFVNDASPDGCLQILRENEKKHPDVIRVVDSPVNRCLGGARNLGIDAARGEYIALCDSDDVVPPDMLEMLYSAVSSSDADLAFVLCGLIGEEETLEQALRRREAGDMRLRSTWNEAVRRLSGKAKLTDADRERLMAEPVGGVVNALFSRRLLQRCHVRFPEGRRYDDNYWLPQVWAHVEKVALCDRIGYFYRFNPASTVRSRNARHHLDRCVLENALLDAAKENGLFERYHAAWEYLYTKRYVFNSYRIFVDLFDEIPYDVVYGLFDELKKNFPGWDRNRYYREKAGRWQSLKDHLLVACPRLFTKAHLLKHGRWR